MKFLMLPGGICFTQLVPNLQSGSPELESRDRRCSHSLSPRDCHLLPFGPTVCIQTV
jgi:hypothetical protein